MCDARERVCLENQARRKEKSFDRVFYSLSGEIVATEIELQSMPEFDLVEVSVRVGTYSKK